MLKLKSAAALVLSLTASAAFAQKHSDTQLVYDENRIDHHNPMAHQYPIAVGAYLVGNTLPNANSGLKLIGPTVDFNIGENLELGGMFGVNYVHAGGADATDLNFLVGPTFVLPVSKLVDLRFGAKLGFMIENAGNSNECGFQLRTTPIAVGLKLDRLEFIAGTAFDYIRIAGGNQMAFRVLGGDFQVRYRF